MILAAAAWAVDIGPGPRLPQPEIDALPVGAELPEPGVRFASEVAGRAFARSPAVGVSRGMALPRARAELGLWAPHGASVRIAAIATRSGGEVGYLGIDGEAFVPRVQIAEARLDLPSAGLAVAAGLVDDPWVWPHQQAWALRAIAPELGEVSALQERADLGGWVGWTAPGRVFSALVSVTAGEGERRRERNNGVDTSVLLTARFVRDELELIGRAFGREGSRGVQQAPDHRLGASVTALHPSAAGAVQVLAGQGLLGDPSLRPFGVSAWARTGVDLPLVGWARYDLHRAHTGTPGNAVQTARIGGGPRLPWTAEAPAWLSVGWEGTRLGPQANPVAGVALGTDLVFVQLTVDLAVRAGFDG